MRITIDRAISEARIRPDAGDPPIRNESALWVAIKRTLQRHGFDVIKKEMSKDGHMVANGVYYVRSRNMQAPGAFAIWDGNYAIRDAAKEYREERLIDLKLGWDKLPRSGKKIEYAGGVTATGRNPRRRTSLEPTLWMRLGDFSEYEEFGNDLDAVADTLIEAGVSRGRDIVRSSYPGGVEMPGFQGRNYISLYWGDDDANMVKRLNDTELYRIRRAIDRTNEVSDA